MAHQNNLRVSSYNCRSLKNSVAEICELCDSSDLVFLQEHWLLPFELDQLNNLHAKFFATSKSAVDISSSVLVGRPYGGTAILFKKELAPYVTVVETSDPRICAIKYDSTIGPVLFVCVYMPCDQGDAECLENYIDICAKLSVLYSEMDVVHFVVAGDFNCQPGSRFYDAILQLVDDHNLQLSDIKRLTNVFTYCSDGGLRTSWIDHCVCSYAVDQLISCIDVLYHYVSSDHKPIVIVFNGLCESDDTSVNNSVKNNEVAFDWSKADTYCLQMYKTVLHDQLSRVDIPVDILTEADSYCDKFPGKHCDIIVQTYYDSVMSCIMNACHLTIPCFTQPLQGHNIPGWNDYVDEKHGEARSAYLEWIVAGKPRQGISFVLMNKTRAAFKLSLRYCKQHEDMMRADSYAKSLTSKDFKSFWSGIHKNSNAKAAQYAMQKLHSMLMLLVVVLVMITYLICGVSTLNSYIIL